MKEEKKVFLLFVLLINFAALCHAQNSKFALGLATDLGFGSKGYKVVTPHVYGTYDITPKLHAGVRVEDAIALMKTGGV